MATPISIQSYQVICSPEKRSSNTGDERKFRNVPSSANKVTVMIMNIFRLSSETAMGTVYTHRESLGSIAGQCKFCDVRGSMGKPFLRVLWVSLANYQFTQAPYSSINQSIIDAT